MGFVVLFRIENRSTCIYLRAEQDVTIPQIKVTFNTSDGIFLPNKVDKRTFFRNRANMLNMLRKKKTTSNQWWLKSYILDSLSLEFIPPKKK